MRRKFRVNIFGDAFGRWSTPPEADLGYIYIEYQPDLCRLYVDFSCTLGHFTGNSHIDTGTETLFTQNLLFLVRVQVPQLLRFRGNPRNTRAA